MLKVEVNRAKRLVRRISSKHFKAPSQHPGDVPPLPDELCAFNISQAAGYHNRAAKRYNLGPAVTPSVVASHGTKDLVQAAISQQITEVDNGIFALTLIRNDIYPHDLSQHPSAIKAPEIEKATVDATKRHLSLAYEKVETRFATYFDAVNLEPSLPQDRDVEERGQLYQYQLPDDEHPYPPCLLWIPPEVRIGQTFGPNHLFDHMRLLDTVSIVSRIIPQTISNWLHDSPESDTFRGIEDKELALRTEKADIYTSDNIGCRRDWYTDRVFAQQQFTGTNPTTLTQASASWMSDFMEAATTQKNTAVLELFRTSSKDSFYVQDCSYFREAIQEKDEGFIEHIHDGTESRFLGATVSLYQLRAQGELHPLASILDYRQTISQSVVIFNERLSPAASSESEETDWPWRYAKMAAQAADWTRHEITIHLTNTHLVEEAGIVACNRMLPATHVVYKLLQPHWLKTLSLNAAARSTLVPSVIVPIAGMSEKQVYSFIRHGYRNFNWTALNVPTDLTNRGFPISEIHTSPKYHNYAYGRDVHKMWMVLLKFVKSVLQLAYPNDASVAADSDVRKLAEEIRSPTGGQITSFPIPKTIDELADVVTMMIHIASPQHTAVNYTQNYYMSFLPNKPTSLCTRLPDTLAELMTYKEADLIKALPVNRPREWLLAMHLPHLLSYRVAEAQNLVNYAISLTKAAVASEQVGLAEAAAQLWMDLRDCEEYFKAVSNDMDDQTKPYHVLLPQATAVSILI